MEVKFNKILILNEDQAEFVMSFIDSEKQPLDFRFVSEEFQLKKAVSNGGYTD